MSRFDDDTLRVDWLLRAVGRCASLSEAERDLVRDDAAMGNPQWPQQDILCKPRLAASGGRGCRRSLASLRVSFVQQLISITASDAL
jgi:hypothetical protein